MQEKRRHQLPHITIIPKQPSTNTIKELHRGMLQLIKSQETESAAHGMTWMDQGREALVPERFTTYQDLTLSQGK